MKTKIIDLSNPLWLETLNKLRYDFYHLPQFVYLESKRTNTTPQAILISEGEKIFFLPYLIRRCDNLFGEEEIPEVFDVVSPYGYPGILLSETAANSPDFLELAINNLIFVLRNQNICSAFFRLHPILNQGLEKIYSPDICKITGETVAINLNLSHEEIWTQTHSSHRKIINRQKRNGITVKMVLLDEYLENFLEIYYETMERVGAAKLYYFSQDFFWELSKKLTNNLHLSIVEFENEIMSACLFTECCGIVQSYLSGTKNKFLKFSPDKIMFDYVRFWAKERGNKFMHLGGGYRGTTDGIYDFKSGFSKLRYKFLTLRLITDQEKYNYLVYLRAKFLNQQVETLLDSSFFPAYRSLEIISF
ncbi:MAG: GNAT family N-acetyltransferase [Fischerella sp. CENA71]|nr:GNAT family N-acetyltransferase [Fischerella sp. CENA71]